MQSEQVNELAGALAKAQGEMDNAVINKINPHFKSRYADLSSIRDAVHKALPKNGLSVTQTMELRENGMVLRTTLLHSSGQWVASEYPLPTTGRPQEIGSALTYARRYSLAAIVSISADEDDDANAAEDQKQRIDAAGKSPISPQAIAPETGEPRVIMVPLNDAGDGSDWVKWGQIYVATLRAAPTAAEVTAWSDANQKPLETMEKAAPKLFKNMMKAASEVFKDKTIVDARVTTVGSS